MLNRFVVPDTIYRVCLDLILKQMAFLKDQPGGGLYFDCTFETDECPLYLRKVDISK